MAAEGAASVASVLARLDRIYAIGGGRGANRIAFGPGEDEAHDLVRGWMVAAGLDVSDDRVGNLFGRLPGRDPGAGEVWTGSHLDSVPGGGRFDGVLGVVAGLEAVSRLGAQKRTLCVVAFRDEEGCRFGRGCTGSRALAGLLVEGELDAVDADGVRLRTALGGAPPTSGWLEPPSAFVEAHVEQGPVLDRLGAPLGVASAISGLARLAVTFTGEGGHAGTTPMAGRRDALVAAAGFVQAVARLAPSLPGAVATVGELAVEPGVANVVPHRVRAVVDARAPDEGTLAALLEAIEAAAAPATVELLRRTAPVQLDEGVASVVRRAVERVTGLVPPALVSGAGHDAGVLAAAGVPAGLLFVRSRAGGVSHSPDEHTDGGDVALCVAALAAVLARLATSR